MLYEVDPDSSSDSTSDIGSVSGRPEPAPETPESKKERTSIFLQGIHYKVRAILRGKKKGDNRIEDDNSGGE